MSRIIRFTLPLFIGLSISCKKDESVNPCIKIDEKLRGHYKITIMQYPRQSSQEGDSKEIRLYTRLDKCFNIGGQDAIYFYNLFNFYNCSPKMALIDNYKFIVEYQDGHEWEGAPVKGEGAIVNEKFSFKGTIYTSVGEFPIVLGGSRISSIAENNICW